MRQQFDLVIRGGTVVDGSGNAPCTADVAISGGRIAQVAPSCASGLREIDATGKIVTPGFVDIHTHYDGQAIWSKRLNPSSSHGVTTVVTGNCGVGFAPCRAQDREMLIQLMEGVEDVPGVVMAEGLAWDWETFPDFLDALEARPRDIDIATYVPHSPLRVYAMGERGAAREPASQADLQCMRELVHDAMAAGAIGVATSRLAVHRGANGAHIPSFEAEMEELFALADGMKQSGTGIFQMVMNFQSDDWSEEIDRLIQVVEHSGRPATWTLGTPNTGPRIWEKCLDKMEAANRRGMKITGQVLPRPIGMITGHQLPTNPFVHHPGYELLGKLSHHERVARLREPAIRQQILSECPPDDVTMAQFARDWDWMFPLLDPPDYAPLLETSIGALARDLGKRPEEVAYDYLLERSGTALLYHPFGNYYGGDLDTVFELLNRSDTVMGLGDGGAHYGLICDASYPTFVLGYWVRDRDGARLSLEQAVRMLSRDPAEVVGLLDRGLVAPGMKADLNVIDLGQLQLHAPRPCNDLPAGGGRLDQAASGYVATIVSGREICRHDRPTGELPGCLVRGTRAMPPEVQVRSAHNFNNAN